jgi:site-specific DNA-methyltransferase (adenine-specific)
MTAPAPAAAAWTGAFDVACATGPLGAALVYGDDRIRLYGGDGLAVLAALPDASVDALVTDPPYSSGGMVRSDRTGVSSDRKYLTSPRTHQAATTDGTPGGAGAGGVAFSGDNRDQRGYAYWCALWLGQAARVVRPGGLGMLFTDWRQLPTTTDALQAGGWVWRGIVPWVKPLGRARPQAGRFSAQCEYVVWGSVGPLPLRPGVDPALPGFYHSAAPREREHLTQKPLDLLQDLLALVPAGGTVLDPFMGSGTTGVAAVATGRRFVGAEQVPHYAAVAERRIRAALGHPTTRDLQQVLDLTRNP